MPNSGKVRFPNCLQEKLNNENMQSELINMAWAWNKEKHLSPWQESNPWPPEQQAGALSTELRELIESKVF